MKKVLFLSTGSSCRAPIAEGIINYYFKGKIEAVSAGVVPTAVHPHAVTAMKEIGIDISEHAPHKPEDFQDEHFDYIITLCDDARENCPIFWTQGEASYEHMGFENPELYTGSLDGYLQYFRDIRDQIEEKLLNFFDRELGNQERRRRAS